MANYVNENQAIQFHEELDKETGEVVTIIDSHEVTTQRFYKDSDEFIQIYLQDMSGLLQITSKTELRVLGCLWKYSNYCNDSDIGNRIVVHPKLFEDINKETGVIERTARNTISALSKKDILIKDKKFRATYYLNPKYFFKGSIKDRPKKMKMVIEYINKDEFSNSEFDKVGL